MACDLALRQMDGCLPDFGVGPVILRLRLFPQIPRTARWANCGGRARMCDLGQSIMLKHDPAVEVVR